MKKSLLAAALLVGFAASAQQTPQLVQPCTMASASNYCQPTTPTNALPTMPADAVNYNNTTLTNGTVTNGIFSSGTVTNPTVGQVILGPIDTTGANSFAFNYFYTSGSGFPILVQESATLAGPYITIPMQTNLNTSTNTLGYTAGAGTSSFAGAVRQKYLQITVNTGTTGVATITGYLRNSTFVSTLTTPTNFGAVATNVVSGFSAGTFNAPKISSAGYSIVLPYSTPELTWQYSTNGTPITTATTTQLNAAGASGVRNYITGIQCDNTGALGTGIQILDGAAVIWDRQIGAVASAQPGQLTLPGGIPLRGSPATAISLKTVSGTTISVTCSVQGYQAS